MNANHEKALDKLRKIFAENSDKRICVVGFSCIGKSTLVRDLPECLDFDDIVWQQMPKKVYDELKSIPEPWDETTMTIWKEYVKNTHVNIKLRQPVFSIRVEDCDLLVYLTLDEKEHRNRVAKRKKDFELLANHRAKIEKAVKESNLPTITVKLD